MGRLATVVCMGLARGPSTARVAGMPRRARKGKGWPSGGGRPVWVRETLTNEIGMVPAQLVVQFLRVRLVDGGPEAATPRDYRLDVLGSRRPGGYGGVAT